MSPLSEVIDSDLGFGWRLRDIELQIVKTSGMDLSKFVQVERLSNRRDRCVTRIDGVAKSFIAKTSPNRQRLSNEWNILSTLAESGLAPNPIRYIGGRTSDLFTEGFIEPGVPSSLGRIADSFDSKLALSVEEALLSLYGHPVPALSDTETSTAFSDWLGEKLLKWSKELHASGDSSSAQEALSCSIEIDALPKNFTPLILHGDLRPANFILSGNRCVLIDFENTSVGDPLFDLAKLTTSLPLWGERIARNVANQLPNSSRSAQCVDSTLRLYAKAHTLGVLAWESRKLTLPMENT